MKNLITLSIALLSIITFAQCPDSKANEYKTKLQKYGDQSYATLVTYYYYKCQFENGIANRTPEQVNLLVDQYNNIKDPSQGNQGISSPNVHQIEWVTISKVTSCKSSNGSTSSQNTSSGSNNSQISQVAKDMNLIEILNIINGSLNISDVIEKLNARNIDKLNSYTFNALNKLTVFIEGFPFTGSEV